MRIRPFCIEIMSLLFLSSSCASSAPSDDPSDYDVDSSVEYRVEVDPPTWLIPSDKIPPQIRVMASNNNVDIEYFEDRLFVAWRSAPTHFAGKETKMFIMSSKDDGNTWEFEHEIALGTDAREPRLLGYNSELQLIFFEAGDVTIEFRPKKIWRCFRESLGKWTEIETMIDEAEVPWDIKVRNEMAYMTSYAGGHYRADESVRVFFKQSLDGRSWTTVDDVSFVYEGGVSEVAFEFDENQSLWAVTRNEDGDDSGFGSHVCRADTGKLGNWRCPTQSDPARYDSPEMFRHGKDLYMVARRDIGGDFKDGDLVAYSSRPKTTALYQIDRASEKVVHLMDLPGAGDNAFPAVRRSGPHTFTLVNYTSPLDKPDISWIEGQLSEKGTQIYLTTIRFVAE
jgi:hypothetical protein